MKITTRESCLFCVSKHISQAIVLMQEAYAGYPEHRWLAVGHLGEAEAESQSDFPLLAQMIRETRCRIMGQENCGGAPSLMNLLRRARSHAESINGRTDQMALEDIRNLTDR